MTFDFSSIDVATVIAAVVAAVSAIYTAITSKKDNLKKDMLGNLTAERIEDLHNIKKWSNVILSEATVALNVSKKDIDEKVTNIVQACNELWFIFKPVYVRDCEVLHSLKALEEELLLYYTNESESVDENSFISLREKRDSFRKVVFLYVHSSWTCIKNQILKGEQSGYKEFEAAYASNISNIDKILNSNEYKEFFDVWEF